LYNKINTRRNENSSRENLLKFALVTDIHVNYDYTAGVSNNCGKPSCCKPDSGPPISIEESSGKWGDKRCDASPQVVDNMMDYISEIVKPDFFFWGGDSVGHDIDTET
jgi:sphingomyelin phosphodiesterase